MYYEEFIKSKKNEKENNKNEKKKNKIENNNKNNENEKMENNAIEIKNNINEKGNNIKNNENEKNNNKLKNKFTEKEKEISKRNNSNLEMPNQTNDLQLTKSFIQNKEKWDYNDDKIQNDKNLKNENLIKFKDIEFIHEKCFLCHKKSENKIYKDYIENKLYLCEDCYKQNKKIYKDNYFEIKFPKKLVDTIKERKIKRKELGNKPIIDFNKFLNNIFFDKEGNFSLKEINEISEEDFSELKRIYEDMILIKEDLLKFFADYQAFINNQKTKLDDNEKKLIEKKLELVMDNMVKLKI